MKYEEIAKDIVACIGGTENIESATHCFTRLRFKLKDSSKVDKQKLETVSKVMGIVEANGQFQVIIGNDVKNVYQPIEGMLAGQSQNSEGGGKKKASFKEVLNAIASIFTPTIPALAGAGVIKGLLVLLTTYKLLENTTATYQILSAASDSIFYFMPVILGYTCAKVFQCNAAICMAIGGSLIYPSLVSFMAENTDLTFIGIPVISTTYASTVIPIILASFVYSKLEKLLEKFVPNMVKAVVSPMISLLIMVPATLILFGPFGNYASQFIGDVFQKLTQMSPLLAGAFFGGTYSILVMFGMHRALVPIGINEVSVMGSTTLWAFTGPSNFAQAGAAFGAFFRIKDKEMKPVALSSSITALFGITEPALYGVNLKYKKPMIAVVISGAVGGAIAGVGGAKAYAVAIPSILTLPTFFGEGFAAFVISIIVAFAAAAVLTLIIGVDEGDGQNPKTEEKEIQKTQEIKASAEKTEHTVGMVCAPVSGNVIAMEDISDEAFSSGALGKGCAIQPSEGKVYAPVSGKVESLFPTNHALGIAGSQGVEVLVHIGIDTVNLEGKYFTAHISQDDEVKEGDLLIEFDVEGIKKAGYKTDTIVLVTNADDYNDVTIIKEGTVSHGEDLVRAE